MSRVTAHSNDDWITGGGYGQNYTYARNGDAILQHRTDPSLRIGQCKCGLNYWVYRSFLQFDTSIVAAGDTVSAASIGLRVYSDQSTQDFTINVYAYDWKETTSYAIAMDVFDLGAAGSRVAAAATLLSGPASSSSGKAAGALHTLTLTGTDLNYINKGVGAYSRFALRSSRDISNTQPGTAEYQDVFSANYGTASYRPYLDITHQAGGVMRRSRIVSSVLVESSMMPF